MSLVQSFSSAPTHDSTHFQAAYEATRADRESLDRADLLPINLDVGHTLTLVLSLAPGLIALRSQVESELPKFDTKQLEQLDVYARALAYAQTVYFAASTPTEHLPGLGERAAQIRDLFLSDAQALARRGVLDGKRLAELKGGVGYLNIASDVGVLARIFRENWNEVSQKSAIQASEVDEAERIFEQVTLAYAARARQPAQMLTATEDRQRAFTLLLRAYDETRRAVTYLRWREGDADKIAPSLWAGRGGREKQKAGTSASSEAPNENGNGTSHANGTETRTPAPPPVGQPEVETGLPGGSPFAHN